MRSLAETACVMASHPEGRTVRWMQREYDPIEIGILKPTPLGDLRVLVSNEELARRGHPGIAIPSARVVS